MITRLNTLFSLIFLLILSSCGTDKNTEQATSSPQVQQAANPAAEGFRASDSDKKAISIADEVMQAMGGRSTWDNTAHIHWTFFGNRHLLWDKLNQQVRIEIPKSNMVIVTDLRQEGIGKVWANGQEMTEADSVAKYVKQGKSIWINDAYWLVMPFKLKDSGVALNYTREDTTQAGANADVLTLTFQGVGDTPQNKYEVWVDKTSKLVTQWAYFQDASQTEPKLVTPWDDYQEIGGLMLSGDRKMAKLTNIQIPSSLPENAFTTGKMILPMSQTN